MNNPFTIEAGAVQLRAFKEQDYQELYELTRQSEITKILPDWDMTEEQLKAFVSFVIASYATFDPEDVRILLALEHKADKRIIGWCGVFPNDLLDPAVREVAYAVSKDYRNQGYSTSAVKAILSFIFESTVLDQVVAIVKPFNKTSSRVLEKAGFQHIQRKRLADQAEYDYFEIKKK